jgi:hypothetical protein
MRLISIDGKPREDLADHLEELAARVRGGGIVDLVMFFDGKDTGMYHYEATCSYERAVALTAMAHAQAIQRMEL